jgi:hypothetical protein
MNQHGILVQVTRMEELEAEVELLLMPRTFFGEVTNYMIVVVAQLLEDFGQFVGFRAILPRREGAGSFTEALEGNRRLGWRRRYRSYGFAPETGRAAD